MLWVVVSVGSVREVSFKVRSVASGSFTLTLAAIWACSIAPTKDLSTDGSSRGGDAGSLDADEGADAARGLGPDRFCGQFLEDHVSRFSECGGGEKDYYRRLIDQHGLVGECLAAVSSARRGRSNYREERAERCLQAIREKECVELAWLSSPITECPTVFEGVGQIGDDCANGVECQSGSHCDLDALDRETPCSTFGIVPTCTRKCIAETGTVAEGETCRSSRDCLSGHLCEKSFDRDAIRVCRRVPRAGESCEALKICDCDAYCDSQDDLCRSRVGEGEVCLVEPADIFLGSCPLGLACYGVPYGSPPTCQQGKRIGESCGSEQFCAYFGYCSQEGVCIPFPLRGEACDESRRVRCLGFNYCSRQDGPGVCVARKETGEACGDHRECLNNRLCVDGMCISEWCP